MSAPTMDPAAVTDAWRLEERLIAKDDSGDALVVERYGDRLDIWTTLSTGRRGWTVVFPNDCDAVTLDALESVVREIQAFLEQARNR